MLTNKNNISLGMAVWLATDNYDSRNPHSNYISATALNKPIKSLVLSKRVPQSEQTLEISDIVASRLGTAVHDSLESAWKADKNSLHSVLRNLGYSQKICDRILVNPTPEDIENVLEPICVYVEQRSFKEFCGYWIGGKYDLIVDGCIEDLKTCKVYSYQSGSNVDSYRKQASIYRWLNQDKVTKEYFNIHYLLTDWLGSKSKIDPSYPKQQIVTVPYSLMSLEETEAYIKDVITKLYLYSNEEDQSKIPRCTDEQLWRTDPIYKYYKNPQKTDRSTKNFDSLAEANLQLVKDGSVGIIKVFQGEVKRCHYCDAFPICKQKDEYILNGTLIL